MTTPLMILIAITIFVMIALITRMQIFSIEKYKTRNPLKLFYLESNEEQYIWEFANSNKINMYLLISFGILLIIWFPLFVFDLI
jgi:hypothetical protein